MAEMQAVVAGVHVLDVLVRPVEEIPEGQGGELVDQIRITAAGSAGGTALVLGKLGADVRSAGAIGNDAVGQMLVSLLERDGVDTSLLVRREDVQTSATVLPIRPNGERPALHVIGANATFGPGDVPTEAFQGISHLHIGAPEFMGGEAAAELLSRAHAAGAVTSADILAPGDQASQLVDWIAPVFPELDYLLPNDEQVLGLTGESEIEAGCRALVERGIGCVAATCGAEGVIIVDGGGLERVPAFDIEVIDTTAAGMRSPLASCVDFHWVATEPRRRGSGAPSPPRSPGDWGPTTATTTSRRSRRSPRRRRPASRGGVEPPAGSRCPGRAPPARD